MSTQAVYDTLNTLTEHRHPPPLRAGRLVDAVRDREPATTTTIWSAGSCGTVVDVACAVGGIPCAVPDDTQGFVVDEAEVTYWGLCASCAARDPAREDSVKIILTQSTLRPIPLRERGTP